MSTPKRDGIRGIEDELFGSMAKQKPPMAPEENPLQPENSCSTASETLPWEHADSMRAELKRRFPELTDADLDELMM